MFARHRDPRRAARTATGPGEGQYVDVAMLDSIVAMTDIVTNFWSMGLRPAALGPLLIMHGFRARDGWFILQVGRVHQFAALATMVGEPGWLDDPRFATRQGWRDHLEDVIRPAIEGWAAEKTKLEAARELNEAGHRRRPGQHRADVIDDPHVAARHMLVEMPRTDGGAPVSHARQPGEAVEGRRRPRDRACRGSASTPTRCCAPSWASTTPRSPRCRADGVIG